LKSGKIRARRIFSSMRSSKIQLQQLMGEIALLEKDANRILVKVNQRASSGGEEVMSVTDTRSEEEKKKNPLNDTQALNTSYSTRGANKVRVANEKELKRIWAEEVEAEGSRAFFDQTLIKVHWIGGYKAGGAGADNPFKIALDFIKSQPKGRVKDEISCFGYTPSEGIDKKLTPVGVIIKGYTTFAYGADAGTQMTSRATDVDRRKHSGSGLHKRPQMQAPWRAAQLMIVDEESWAADREDAHEVIVDNWVVDGVIIPSFQKMVDDAKSSIKTRGIGAERRGEAEAIVDKARRDFQELGRQAADTGIAFYNDQLQPIDFSGKEFEVGELTSEWDKVLSSDGDTLTGVLTGDPDVPEVVIEGRTIVSLKVKGISKNITFKDCDFEYSRLDFNDVKGSLVRFESCQNAELYFLDGQGSIEVINPKDRKPGITALYDSFKLKSGKFVGCDFIYASGLTQNLRDQHEKNGAIITFENCTNLPDDAESWARPPGGVATPPPPPPPVFYYHGPGKPGVTQVPADIIADFIRANRSGDHKVHVGGNWVDAATFLRVSESRLQQLVREELLNEDVRRRGGKWCAYVDDKLTKAEKEANPKRHKGKAVGAVQRTPDGKIRMKARACYASKKKANNAMAAAMMEGAESGSLDQLLEEIAEVEALLEGRKPPPGTLWKNIRNRRKAGKRRLKPGEKGYPKTLDFD